MNSEFAEDFALELAMLETAFPPRWDLENGIVDLRGDSARILDTITDAIGFGEREKLAEGTFLPLLFCAAWKLLDIIIERGMQSEDPRQQRPQIATKVKRVNDTEGADFIPLLLRADIAKAIAGLYANTHELRHAVVHRRVGRGADGALFGNDLIRLAKAEAIALCELAIIVGRCASALADRRAQSHAAWLANKLTMLHGGPILPDAHKPKPMDVVLVAAERDSDRWIVNTELAHQRVTDNGHPFAWLEVHPPSNEFAIVRTQLHEAPRGCAERFYPSGNPHWV